MKRNIRQNTTEPQQMLIAVSFVFLGACLVSSNPVEKKSYSIQVPKDLELQDEFLGMEERRSKRCSYNGKKYKQGTVLDINMKPDYARCDRCTCIKRKFQNCTKIFDCEVGYLQCSIDEYEWRNGDCCPSCKRKSCGGDRKVGDNWQRRKTWTEPNKGICSLCECKADGKEFCEDHHTQCFANPGCQETEVKPDFCCPQCKTRATTTQPWFTILLTTERPPPTGFPPFPFPFDSNEDQEN
ncbi:hypothetical protein OS493_016021 [Desmophyllum pertusum]|uniref:VWFC domain-containing protein n=1 Tax=Desmophyllum pertusum TaxID=174260 RepID=A0A9X0D9Q9_9CNID|nr:hypothetical protein OS493_016021 [Desmophyllum pertusum]